MNINPIKIVSGSAGKERSAGIAQFYEPDGRIRKRNSPGGHKTKISPNVWTYSPGHDGRKKFHPAVFPVQLVKDHIISWSNEGDVILDPFMGSGTTGVVCADSGRKFIGIEQNVRYFMMAETRIRSHCQ